jgi:hypothetical protein
MKLSNFPLFFQKILRQIQRIFKSFFRLFRALSKQNPVLFEKIELTFMYFFASIVLFYAVINSLGYLPGPLYFVFPFLPKLLTFPPLMFFARPEQTFFLYLLSLEFIVNRNLLRFSLLVKYNLLLIFIVEMVENLVVTLWDFIFIREVELFIFAGIPITSELVAFFFFLIFFIVFFSLYVNSYVNSLRGKFPVFPGFLKCISDCVRFWLQMKD